ncbi:MAG: tetratricopeptide repeat protein [Nitrospina sp.]|jgi:chemotaxis protein methyltransferase CheR|nr:tetratricopeptide repeat protein [Nitrospina sp.]
MELSPFIDLINKNCGLLIESNLSPNLPAAINARITKNRFDNSNQYFKFLQNSSEEIQSLIDLITNNETYFFRERLHFQICIDRLIPEILDKKNSKEIKIISAGCSSGEEPYSLAIALADQFGPDIFNTISIIGFDINESVLRTARNGEFGPHSFREAEAPYREKYFKITENNRYQLESSIKDAVKFYRCNLSQPSFPEWLNNADIIFYRNVSIYFPNPTKKVVFENLSNALNETGHLILSSTETFSHNMERLSLVEIEERFFYTKQDVGEQNFETIPTPQKLPKPSRPIISNSKKIPIPPKPLQPLKKEASTPKSPAHLFEMGLKNAIQKNYDESFSNLKALLDLEPTHIEAQNLYATIHINLKQLEKAKELCRSVVKQDEWNIEARLLSGIIARMEENHNDAAKWFKSVTFIQPSCWTAHMHLAELHNIEEDFKGAFKEYSLALKHLEKSSIEKRNLSYFPLAYNKEQLIHLFKHNLKNLK